MKKKRVFKVLLEITFDNDLENSSQNKETLIRNVLTGIRQHVEYDGLYPEDAETDGVTKEVKAVLDEIEGSVDFRSVLPDIMIITRY